MDPLFHSVRSILLDKWDPVGVGDNPALRDEYDAFIGDIIRLMNESSTTAQTIIDYLSHVETDFMGMTGNQAARASAAEALIVLARKK